MTYDGVKKEEEDALFHNDILRWPSDYQPLQAVVTNTNINNNSNNNNDSSTTIITTNPSLAPPPPILNPSKQYHPEWGVIKDQDFHPLTLKHQRDLENLYQTGSAIPDFYFWQANLGGYCMADMVQGIVVSSEGAFVLERKIVEGAPHPGRRKKKRGLG
ncbi:hypothetical protein MFLAVUS_003926 [Mucor flavus]|uniref:Uncharacterized protein n=1 Tax=Mucor flavus TaxID=439312 RepID=A0ABP9YUF1_9FUNG